MTEQEMKIIHERLKNEDPKLLSVMEKCFDAGVLSGKEQSQRTWVGLTDEEMNQIWLEQNKTHGSVIWRFSRALEAKLKEKNA